MCFREEILLKPGASGKHQTVTLYRFAVLGIWAKRKKIHYQEKLDAFHFAGAPFVARLLRIANLLSAMYNSSITNSFIPFPRTRSLGAGKQSAVAAFAVLKNHPVFAKPYSKTPKALRKKTKFSRRAFNSKVLCPTFFQESWRGFGGE